MQLSFKKLSMSKAVLHETIIGIRPFRRFQKKNWTEYGDRNNWVMLIGGIFCPRSVCLFTNIERCSYNSEESSNDIYLIDGRKLVLQIAGNILVVFIVLFVGCCIGLNAFFVWNLLLFSSRKRFTHFLWIYFQLHYYLRWLLTSSYNDKLANKFFSQNCHITMGLYCHKTKVKFQFSYSVFSNLIICNVKFVEICLKM